MVSSGVDSGALWVIKFGKVSIWQNLVMTSPYVRTDFPVRGKKKRIPPLFPREFCPLLFQKSLEMIDKSESVNWPNVWWILGAEHLTSEGLWVISEKNVLHTAHAPNFNFRTGCREIKRCEESKRTLKNPFASRFAEFGTTLKLLRITDQWYIVSIWAKSGFFGVTFIAVSWRTKRREAL